MQNRDPLTPTEKHIYSPTNRQEFRRKYNILIEMVVVVVKKYKKNMKWVSDTVNSMVVYIVWFKSSYKKRKINDNISRHRLYL
jgi:hypothetical protein